MAEQPSVVHVMPDTMGGVVTIVANLLKYRGRDRFSHQVVLTHNRLHNDQRSAVSLAADRVTKLEYSLPVENISHVARRLHAAIGTGPGVMVCHDHIELLLAASRQVDRTVIQVLHG